MTEHAINHFTAEMTKRLNAAGIAFGEHSIYSPSGSSMWAFCSGSLVPNLFAKDSSGEDAAIGTVAHGVAEVWMKTGERPDHMLGTVHTVKKSHSDEVFEITVDVTMMDFVEEYVAWCMYLPGSHFIETRVDFSDLTPLKRQTGTADHAVCQPGKLIITDLKYGKGIQVFAKENTQAILYAYGFFRKYDDLFDFQTITIRIAQPRLHHFDVWEITREELLQWASWLKVRAYAAWCKDASRTPGEKQCRFCKVKVDCGAHAAFIAKLTEGVFENLEEPISQADVSALKLAIDDGSFGLSPVGIGSLNTAQKAAILKYRKTVESWFSDLFSDLEQRVINGEHVPGFKLAQGRANRVFRDKDAAAELLDFLGLDDDVIRPRGMITPAQAEDELRKVGYKRKQLPDLLKPVVLKPTGKPSMVPETDSRPALASIADSTFENLDDL